MKMIQLTEKDFARLLETARTRAGFTTVEKAASPTCNVQTIKGIEAAKNYPSMRSLLELLDTYGLDFRGVHELLHELKCAEQAEELQAKVQKLEARLAVLEKPVSTKPK